MTSSEGLLRIRLLIQIRRGSRGSGGDVWEIGSEGLLRIRRLIQRRRDSNCFAVPSVESVCLKLIII